MDGEPPDHYALLVHYAGSGATRSREATAKHGGVSLKTIQRCAKRWNWLERAVKFDAAHAVAEVRTQFEIREAVRASISEAAPGILARLVGWLTDSETKPSTGIPGALRYLELAGYTPPKRIELDVDDRRDKAIAAAERELELLTPAQLAALDEALGPDPVPAADDAG